MSTRYILVAGNTQNVAILAQAGKGIASTFEGLVSWGQTSRRPIVFKSGNRPFVEVDAGLLLECVYLWGCSSSGRAPRSQCGGQGFDPPQLHHIVMVSSRHTCQGIGGLLFFARARSFQAIFILGGGFAHNTQRNQVEEASLMGGKD